MGLFGNDGKRAQKAQALLEKYGLEELSDPRDIESVRQLSYDLMGNKLIELGTVMQGNAIDPAKLTYLSALVQQNFIIIRQLDRLNRNMENKA